MSDEQTGTKPRQSPPQTEQMPPWKLLLHNDDENSMQYVARTLTELLPLEWDRAVECMTEAHHEGTSLLLTTHKERAELFQEQLTSKGLSVTIEPDEQ